MILFWDEGQWGILDEISGIQINLHITTTQRVYCGATYRASKVGCCSSKGVETIYHSVQVPYIYIGTGTPRIF